MYPRLFTWTCIISAEQKINEGSYSYAKNVIRHKLCNSVATESITIAEHEWDKDSISQGMYKGDIELRGNLYVLTENEMKDFILHITRCAQSGRPFIL